MSWLGLFVVRYLLPSLTIDVTNIRTSHARLTAALHGIRGR